MIVHTEKDFLRTFFNTRKIRKGGYVLEVLKISSTKIKIMLTAEDMKKYALNVEELDYSNTKTRTKVWKILDYIKKNHGFDPEGDKLLIQFYPSKDGSSELFVTKLSGLSRGNERFMSKSGNVTMLDSKRTMYNFESLTDLIQASKIINGTDKIKDSNLFYSETEGYYLEITERGASRLGEICEFAILLEFASKTPKEKIPYITEHCKQLTDGSAVEKLAKL